MSQKSSMQPIFKKKSIITGIIVFISILIICSLVYSIMLLKDNVSDASTQNGAIIILGISSIASGIAAGMVNKIKGIQTGTICAILQVVLLMLISILFREKTPFFCVENWIKFAIIIIFNAIGGIIGVNVKKKY